MLRFHAVDGTPATGWPLPFERTTPVIGLVGPRYARTSRRRAAGREGRPLARPSSPNIVSPAGRLGRRAGPRALSRPGHRVERTIGQHGAVEDSRPMRSRPTPLTSNRPSASVVQVFRPPGQIASSYRRTTPRSGSLSQLARGEHRVEVDPVLDRADPAEPDRRAGDRPALRYRPPGRGSARRRGPAASVASSPLSSDPASTQARPESRRRRPRSAPCARPARRRRASRSTPCRARTGTGRRRRYAATRPFWPSGTGSTGVQPD